MQERERKRKHADRRENEIEGRVTEGKGETEKGPQKERKRYREGPQKVRERKGGEDHGRKWGETERGSTMRKGEKEKVVKAE